MGRQASGESTDGDDDETGPDPMLTKHTAMFDVRPAEEADEIVVLDTMFSTEEAPARPAQTPLFAVDLTDAHIDPSEFPEYPELMSGTAD